MTNIKNSIDWQALLKITENPDIAKELLTMFAVELPKFRTEINTAYEQKDYATLKDRAHKLHGCCCYAGFSVILSSACQSIEFLMLVIVSFLLCGVTIGGSF